MLKWGNQRDIVAISLITGKNFMAVMFSEFSKWRKGDLQSRGGKTLVEVFIYSHKNDLRVCYLPDIVLGTGDSEWDVVQ